MISDYISKEAVSNMTFSEFEERMAGNIEIARHRLTMKDAFIELGGKITKEPKKNRKTLSSEDK